MITNKNDIDFIDEQEEVDLIELYQVLMKNKITIAVVTVLAGAFSVAFALNMENYYVSEALLAPRTQDGGVGELGRLASQFGGLAALGGININNVDPANKTPLAIQTMTSFVFFKNRLYEQVVVDLFAAKSWDAKNNVLLYDATVYDPIEKKWTRDFPIPKPSEQQAYNLFLSKISIAEDNQTGFISITADHLSPVVAKNWISMMISGINAWLKEKDVAEAQKSIEFLQSQMIETNVMALDQIFAQLIQEQTKKVMLANVTQEYVFQVIDPPFAPEERDRPNRTLVCIIVTAIGFLLSVFFVFVKHFLFNKNVKELV